MLAYAIILPPVDLRPTQNRGCFDDQSVVNTLFIHRHHTVRERLVEIVKIQDLPFICHSQDQVYQASIVCLEFFPSSIEMTRFMLIRSDSIHVFTNGKMSYTLCSDNSNGQVISLI
jgi:hypothetical protein